MNIVKLFPLVALLTQGTLFGAGPAPAPAPAAAEVHAKADANPAIVTTADQARYNAVQQSLQKIRTLVYHGKEPAADTMTRYFGRVVQQLPSSFYPHLVNDAIQTRSPRALEALIKVLETHFGGKSAEYYRCFTTKSVIAAATGSLDGKKLLPLLRIVLNTIDPEQRGTILNSAEDPHDPEQERTPLLALIELHTDGSKSEIQEMAHLLFHYGANINRSYRYYGHLHWTLRLPGWLQFLLENGADQSITDSEGRTPLQVIQAMREKASRSHGEYAAHNEAFYAQTERILTDAEHYKAIAYYEFVRVLIAQGFNKDTARVLAAIFDGYVTPTLPPLVNALEEMCLK